MGNNSNGSKTGYQPEYSKGEILVKFRDFCSDESFVKSFLKGKGYELSDSQYRGIDVFVVKTNPEKEEETLSEFESYRDYIEWVERRDIKLEKRWCNLEQIIDKTRDIHDYAGEIPQEEYNQKLEDLIEYIESSKENTGSNPRSQ